MKECQPTGLIISYMPKRIREVIRKFGRFPTRNEALNRKNTALETDFMKNGGYGMTYTQLANSA